MDVSIAEQSGKPKLSRRDFLNLIKIALGSLFLTPLSSGSARPNEPKFNEHLPQAERPIGDTFKVFLPGVTGGGKNITAIRDYLHSLYGENVVVPPSISNEFSLKKGEDIKSHFANLASEISTKAGNKPIHIVAHSLGGFESLDLVNALLNDDDWSGKEVLITFMSTPGFRKYGINEEENMERISRLLNQKEVAMLEQHTAFPLPEKYYKKHPSFNPNSDEVKTIFIDNEESRNARRNWFKEQLKSLVKDDLQRSNIIASLSHLDKQIGEAIELNLPQEELLVKRSEILNPFIQALFRGEHIDEQTHQKFLTRYGETLGNLAPKITRSLALLNYGLQSVSLVFSGMEKALLNLINQAEIKRKSIKIEFAFVERDVIIKKEEINDLRKEVMRIALGNYLTGMYYSGQLAHSSTGYRPDILLDEIYKEKN